MKTTWNKIFILMGVTASSLLISGCAGGGSDNAGVAPQACSVGYTFYNNQCYPVNGAGINTQPTFSYGNGFYADNYTGSTTLRIVNGARMKEFFKLGMGVCDRAATNYGLASCDSYINGYMDVIIQFPNATQNSLLATFIARPKYNQYGNYSAQLPSGWGLLGIAAGVVTGVYLPDPKQYTGAYRNPLQLEMTVSAINNSQGFEARGYGDNWTGANTTLLGIQVQQGKIEDSQLNFNFTVKGQTAAQGTMIRCRTANCGL